MQSKKGAASAFFCHIKGKASNRIVLQALEMLENMNHRGACGCEPDSGDGAGILVAFPMLFSAENARAGHFKLPRRSGNTASAWSSCRRTWSAPECEGSWKGRPRLWHGRARLARCAGRQRAVRRPDPKKCEPKIRQIFVGMGETFYNRRISTAGSIWSASAPKTRSNSARLPEQARESFTSARCRPIAWSTRGC
jgi:glutamate synthase domain-containing protein 1